MKVSPEKKPLKKRIMKQFQCEHCGVSIRGRVSFVHHLNKIHPTDSKVREDLIKCIFCESYFGIKPALTKHIKKCHKERIGLQRFPCLKCSNNCKYQTSSDKLLTTHDDNKTKNIQCAVCGLTLSNKSYRRHLEVHQGAMHQRSPCPKCSNNSEDQTSSDKKTISIQCAECEKTVSKKAYSRHIKIHQGKTHQCNICNKSFHSSSGLERHLLNLHSDSTNKYECELCGGKFTQKENLHRHIKKQHPVGVTVAKRQNKCPYCTTYFRFEASVNLHVAARHTLKAEVPADNDILSKALEKSKIFLTPKPITPATETNTKDGKLSINCHICSRRFSKFHNLKRHNERTHSHIKSFKCPKCPSGFKYSSLLRKHLKHQHEIKCKTNINSVMLSKINDLMSDIFSRKNGNVILIKKSAIDKSLNGISKDSDTSKEITDISSEAREIETNEILIGLSMPVIDNELINSTFNTVKSNHKSISLQKSKKSRTDIDNTVCENIPQVSDRIINTSTQNVPIKISKTESEPVGVQTNFKDAVLGQANSEALFRVINCDHNKNIRINDANPLAQNFQKNIQSFIDEDINTVSLLSGCDAAEYALVDPAQLNIIQVSDMINNNKNNDKPEDNISATNSDYKKQKQAHEISINTLVIGLDTNVLLPNQNYEAGNLADICSTENFEAYNGSHASQNSDQQIMYTEPSNKFTVKEKNPVEYHIREEPSSEYFLVQSSSILGETVQVKIPDREENDVIQYCTANNATMESNISTLQIQEDVQLTASNVYPKVISTLNQSGIDDQERKNQNMFNVDELLNLNPTNSQKNLKASQIHVVGKPKSSDLQIKDIESFKEHASDYQECEPFAKPQSIFNGDDFDKISQKNIKTKIIANSKDSAMDYPECELMGTHQEIYNDELINLNCKKSLKNTSTHEELELSFDLDDLPLETSIADISLTQLDVIEPCNDSNRNVDEFVEKNAIEDRAFFEATSKKAKDYKSASVKENLVGNEINFIDDGKGNFSPIDKTVLTIQENNHEKLIDDFQEITFTPTTFCLDNNTFVESIDSDLIEIENICPSYGVPQSISMNDYLKNKSISPISSNFVNCSKSSKKSDVQLPIESAEIECTNEANLVPEPTINPNILETDLTEDESVTLLELSNISNYIQGYTQELSGDSRLENIISSEVIDSEIPTVDTITEEIIAPEEILKLLSASRLRSYPHKCRICCASFMKQSDLKKHEEMHSERQQFLCHICGKRMTSEATLKKHEMQHEMKFKLMCLHCKNILAPMSMRLHNCVNNKGRYSCPLCDKSFKYGSSKKHHILTNHVYNKKVKSNHEADVLVGMTNEINEMNDTENKQQLPDVPHRVKKPRTKPKIIHQCDECGMEFQRPTHLEQHKNSHNEVKNFMCECGTAFTHERSLKRHKFKFKSPINGIACIKLLGTNEIDIETQQPQ